MEYPLRPPLFALSIYFPRGQNSSGNDGSDSDWFNELRAMEAEVSSLKKVTPYIIPAYLLIRIAN